MVNYVWLMVAASSGLLCYLAMPFIGASAAPRYRNKIAQYYWGQAARAIGRIALVWRNVGGPSLFEMKIDDEKGAGKVTLDDSMIGDAKELHFDDPDNRMKRWKRKPFVILHENVSGVIDPQLAELGYHAREYEAKGGFEKDGKIDPYFEVPTDIRATNMDDVLSLIIKDSEPTDAATTRDFTRNRFAKYLDDVGAVEVLSTFMGFGCGMGGVAVLQYFQNKILDGGGDTEPDPVYRVDQLEWAMEAVDPLIQTVVLVL